MSNKPAKEIKSYRKADGTSLTSAQLKAATDEVKIEAMREWFDDHFDNPADVAPWDGAEGGWQIPGGGADAYDVLAHEFEELLGLPIIEKFATELNEISDVWVDKSISDPEED